ncbi:hypothetical protein EKO27_g11350 [Xylaria grammica]|uniref:Uncharacterized protein n=1 Tax=Xylaria grammica TaxID=363999 RepID=A0A439CNM5_9PEZI|nr:hypothetical protein EKO27_g11350 [Xylaria grammica]
MRPRSVFLGLAAMFASPAVAQDNDDDDDTSTSVNDDDSSTSSSENSQSTTADDAEQTSSQSDTEETSTTASPTTSTSEASSTTQQSVPTITSNTGDTPALPTIPGAYSYPAPTVPPTKNAPFMQKSNLPQGTVFITVGAILGAFAVAILVWRAVVACLLHRSVKRATLAQQVANDKNSYPPPSAPFYKYSDHASSVSLSNAPGPRAARKSRGPVPSTTPSQSNLFFSPTAPAGAGGSANRESRFLPSGFYASGAASPQQGHGHSISLTNLRPDSRGHPRVEPSPPESPSLAPPHDVGRRNLSSSTINLNRPASGRAPSAFLEDLLGDQPEQFPPPGHRSTWNQPSNRF